MIRGARGLAFSFQNTYEAVEVEADTGVRSWWLGRKGQLLGPGHENCSGLPKKERKRKEKILKTGAYSILVKKMVPNLCKSSREGKWCSSSLTVAMFGLRRCYNNIHAVHVYPLCSPTPENASKSLKISSYQSFILPFIVIL
jgi:hypothetical protein